MEDVPERISFPEEEEKILRLWERLDVFQTSLKRSEGLPEYSFYDGPPFATGLPHYGHILAGTIKDTVTRYAHQTGHHVVRRFGWDCHGLPIEFEIDKELGVKTRDDVLALGIPKYNAACRGIVMRYASEWEKVITRLGRWIDFKNDYKTLDTTFMESVWWVFKQLFDKGLVYRGYKVMPYSMACNTPLSNFEAGMLYKEVPDPSVVVKFPLIEDPTISFLAWTTTPWTLPSNLALCVNPKITYMKLQDKTTGNIYILSANRLEAIYKDLSTAEYTILETFTGEQLVGKTYVPLFNYFESEKEKGAFRVLSDGYVTDETGTGIVHQAPAFGEDDYRVCLLAGIIQKGSDVPCPIDANGRFTSQVPEFEGKNVKEADRLIIRNIKEKGRLVVNDTIVHQYPFCWRSETPLIYRAVPSWFVNVETIKHQLLENNEQTYWVPDYVKKGRFKNWLETARDWAVSRNRYWGTPLPVWRSDNWEEIVVVGSIEELEKLSGVRVTDLHRENIDHIQIPSKHGHGMLSRVEEVFDCWFESGSMPYAQVHYPFENKERFEKTFPADFIAEGIDQTRGWFYTLLVLSTALFNKPPFQNLIVNGLVLAADGKKMSKRLKNYPDPSLVVNTYGADSLRLYLINSPVVHAEDLKFKEPGVEKVLKDVFIPWFNAYRFFIQNTKMLEARGGKFTPDLQACLKSTSIMDRWILASTQSLIQFVRVEMKAYRLYTVVPRLVKFIDQLTNWYVRFNRKRIKGESGDDDALVALRTLFEVLFSLCKIMSPFTPFFAEYLYQNLRLVVPVEEREESVHYLMIPTPVEEAFNPDIEEAVNYLQRVIELARTCRERRKKPLKYPLKELTVVVHERAVRGLEDLKSYILEELNIRLLNLRSDVASFVKTVAVPNSERLGKRLKREMGKVAAAISALSHEQILEFQSSGTMTINEHILTSEDVQVVNKYTGDTSKFEAAFDAEILVVLALEEDRTLLHEGYAREIINRVQRLRKKAKLEPTDPIEVWYELKPGKGKNVLEEVISSFSDFIAHTIGVKFLDIAHKPAHVTHITEKEEFEVASSQFFLLITQLEK